MKFLKAIPLLTWCLFLSSCGPLYGQFMRLSEGLKSYEVVEGNATDLKRASNLLVVGPFWGAENEHHMCIPKEEGTFPFTSEIIFITKYNDAQRFADGFKEAGLFNTELYLDVYYDQLAETAKSLRTMNGLEIRDKLQLKQTPEMILFGRIKKREHKIAALRGVIMDVNYELEFYNPDSRQSIVIDVAVFEMFKQDMKTIIRETGNRMAKRD